MILTGQNHDVAIVWWLKMTSVSRFIDFTMSSARHEARDLSERPSVARFSHRALYGDDELIVFHQDTVAVKFGARKFLESIDGWRIQVRMWREVVLGAVWWTLSREINDSQCPCTSVTAKNPCMSLKTLKRWPRCERAQPYFLLASKYGTHCQHYVGPLNQRNNDPDAFLINVSRVWRTFQRRSGTAIAQTHAT